MCEKNLTIVKGERLFLATFELFSGQYGQIFHKVFYAKSEKNLKKEVHKYLFDYYGEGNVTGIEKNIHYYFDGEVVVKQHGWEEITGFEQLVNKLL
ncbi:MAG: hypothetical protein A2Y48_04530 [Nitrospirae bacterium RIFCSPLOW2_12_42_9]|nr:MAG: hypothetical protein A2Y48_04530 [Nitrospirae bacterium RIFCSPLOW2_12_42_9]